MVSNAIAATGINPESVAADFLYFNQDGIKRGRVAHVGKFF
jgi:hypothetical protein